MKNVLTLRQNLQQQIAERLGTYNYSDTEIEELLRTYRPDILEWQQDYLVMGTHVSPENMADEIVFSERLQS